MSGFTGFKLKSVSKTSSASATSSDKSKLQAAYPLSTAATRPSYGPSFSRKHVTEEDYFESAEDELANAKKLKDLEYQPASGSSSSSNDEEEDPLDSFMSSIEVYLKPKYSQ